MSRKTELATIYRELYALWARCNLVGAPNAAAEFAHAQQLTLDAYRKEVEAIARRAAEAA